jgi:hypothetical protein
MIARREWLAWVRRTAFSALTLPRGFPFFSVDRRVAHRYYARELRIGLLGVNTGPASTWTMGARFGTEEAARTAALMDASVRALELPAGSTRDGLDGLLAQNVAALVANVPRDEWSSLEEGIVDKDVVLMDARLHHPAQVRCARGVFRLGVPEDPARSERVDLLVWHDSLQRYGAEQLNQRFRSRFGVPMDGAAWTAWFACKVVTEAWLRGAPDTEGGLRDYLASERALFDGQKGRPLRFRADHQMEHPLYELSRGGSVVDAAWEWPPGAEACG